LNDINTQHTALSLKNIKMHFITILFLVSSLTLQAIQGAANQGLYRRTVTCDGKADLKRLGDMEVENDDDAFKALGLADTANAVAVKKAYRKLSLQVHPDKNPDKVLEAEAAFKTINAAFLILTEKFANNADYEQRDEQPAQRTDDSARTEAPQARTDYSRYGTPKTTHTAEDMANLRKMAGANIKKANQNKQPKAAESPKDKKPSPDSHATKTNETDMQRLGRMTRERAAKNAAKNAAE
jgi:curved DNA-binding protein CbpA